MKILAEEQIKANQVKEGIETAEGALFLQKEFFGKEINFQVQETMLLLAEAYTINNSTNKALQMYQQILTARDSQASAVTGEATKDIYRKMAPLHTQE